MRLSQPASKSNFAGSSASTCSLSATRPLATGPPSSAAAARLLIGWRSMALRRVASILSIATETLDLHHGTRILGQHGQLIGRLTRQHGDIGTVLIKVSHWQSWSSYRNSALRPVSWIP